MGKLDIAAAEIVAAEKLDFGGVIIPQSDGAAREEGSNFPFFAVGWQIFAQHTDL